MLCAIAVELVPPLVNAQGQANLIGMVVGFTLGVSVMLGMSVFLEAEEAGSFSGTPEAGRSFDIGDEEGGRGGEMSRLLQDDGDDGAAAAITPAASAVRRIDPASDGSVCSDTSNTSSAGRLRNLGLVGGAYRIAAERAKASLSFHGDDQLPVVPVFPYVFAMAVYIDSFMDGLLVGLTLITGKSAGMYMAVAMAVEMGFLGLTFAAACMTNFHL